MKLWPTIIENKYFVKMLWHLLGKCVKVIVLLVCSICTVHRFFLFFIFSQSSICALFSIVFLHGSYSVFHCSSTVPFWLATLSFFFFFNSSYSTKLHCSYNSFFFFSLLFVLFFSFYIYHCTSSVFAMYIYSAILLSHFVFFLFFCFF